MEREAETHFFFLTGIAMIFFGFFILMLNYFYSNRQNEARVVFCHDGDTCVLEMNQAPRKWIRVRLFGIDAPEVSSRKGPGQPLSEESKRELNRHIKGRTVQWIQHDLDHYNRPVVELFHQSKNINLLMLRQGLAERFIHPKTELPRLIDAEKEARLKHIGVWSQTHESPSKFRKRKNYSLNRP